MSIDRGPTKLLPREVIYDQLVRVMVKRDMLLLEAESWTAARKQQMASHNHLLAFLGQHIRGESRYYLTWHGLEDQHNALAADLDALKAGKPLKAATLPADAPAPPWDGVSDPPGVAVAVAP